MRNLGFEINTENILFGKLLLKMAKTPNCSCSSKNTFFTLKDLSSKFIYCMHMTKSLVLSEEKIFEKVYDV
jgi:hypothetical protein